jgi:predicted nucleic acid-binding protein
VTVFLDSAVFMYAVGAQHPLRAPCQSVLRQAADQQLASVTSTEVVQEVLHRFLAIRRAAAGIEVSRSILVAFAPVVPITHRVMARVPDLAERYATVLSARDLVHVATCVEEGITELVTTDTAFDQVAEIRRIDPRDLAT